MRAGIIWSRPPSALAVVVEQYGQRVQQAVAQVGEYIARLVESEARANAPWTDRTGNARRGLTGLSVAAGDLVTVYLFHQMDYGKWLEIARGGPYKIIMPTLEAHYGDVMRLIGSVLRGAA